MAQGRWKPALSCTVARAGERDRPRYPIRNDQHPDESRFSEKA